MCLWLTAPLARAIAAPKSECRGRIVSGRCALHRPYSWEDLKAHAANQSARYAAGEYPGMGWQALPAGFGRAGTVVTYSNAATEEVRAKANGE